MMNEASFSVFDDENEELIDSIELNSLNIDRSNNISKHSWARFDNFPNYPTGKVISPIESTSCNYSKLPAKCNSIPKLIAPNVSRFLELEFESDIDVILCTNKGQFMVFYKGDLKNHCDLPRSDVVRIFLFYNYNPTSRYFLIYATDQLFVTKDGVKLSIVKIFDNVESVTVDDFWKCGTPQVGLKLQDCYELVITNFRNDQRPTNVAENLHEAPSCFETNLKHLKSRLDNANRILEEKKLHHQQIMDEMFDTICCCHVQNSTEQLSCINGCQNNMLIASVPYKTIYNEKWCIILPIRNISDQNLLNVDLNIWSEEKYKSYSIQCFILSRKNDDYCFTNHSFNHGGDYFTRCTSGTLPAETEAYLVATLPLFKFVTGSLISLYITVKYTTKGNMKIRNVRVPEININILDMQSDILVPRLLSNDVKIHHVISIIANSSCLHLSISLYQYLHTDMKTILCENLKFKYAKPLGFFYRLSPVCGVILVQIRQYSPYNWTLTLYTKDQLDNLLFVKEMYAILPVNSIIKMECKDSILGKEKDDLGYNLKFIINILRQHMKQERNKDLPLDEKDDEIVISKKTWIMFQRLLAPYFSKESLMELNVSENSELWQE